MKGSSWNECITQNLARKVSSDIERANSLIETSSERINIIKEINKENCNFVFEYYYTSLLELLQSLVIKKGYNVLNHFCLGYYLKDVLKRTDLYLLFDDLRYKRNALTYYGNKMEFLVALNTIKKAKQLIKEIKCFN